MVEFKMAEDKTQTLFNKFTAKIDEIKPFIDLIGESNFSTLQKHTTDLKRNVEAASQENRLLKIGVVGQIKRGKSSFLNALLFDGEDVLPKAASPMTAALTKISYGDTLAAQVEFYTAEEWQQVVATADEGLKKNKQRQQAQETLNQKGKGGFFSNDNQNTQPTVVVEKPTPEEQACMELVEMAKLGGQDINAYLGKTKVLDRVEHISELNHVLGDYVGASGRFTPFVKSSRLTLNLSTLQDIEVIDTPGINDPIVSRSRVTKDFMGQCDVIFFLSNCGQFLDQADMGLLAQNIPSQGIDDICLIGSLFDSVLLDEGHKYASLCNAAPAIIGKLNHRAEEDFARICQQIEQTGEKAYMAKALQDALPPLFVSAMAFNIAKHWGQLNEIEDKILSSLKRMFSDDNFSRELMLELANLDIVHTKLEQVKLHKDEIKRGKISKLLQRSEPAYRNELKQIYDGLVKGQDALQSGTIEEITTRLNASVSKLEKGKSAVTHVFEMHANDIKKNMANVIHEIKSAALDAKRVASRSGTDTKEESYQVDHGMGFCGWRSLTGNRYETKHRTITVSYTYASVHDAIDQVEDFIVHTEKELMEQISTVVNVEKLREDILVAVKKMVNFENDDFEPDDILRPVATAVSRITIPDVNLDCSACRSSVTSMFNTAEVRDTDISRLQQSIAAAVSTALQMINKAVLSQQEKICTALNQAGQSFISDIGNDLEAQIKRLNDQKSDVEGNLKKYAEALQVIDGQLAGQLKTGSE